MTLLLAFTFVLLLAYGNGANDNFKGVATLFGSGVSDYRRALFWGTFTTFAGSVAAVVLAMALVETFSGRQFVSADTLALPGYALSVCAAAAATVLLATRIGAPISTTHAIAGALLGAAFAAPESVVDWNRAGSAIILPLAAGPVLAIAGAMLLYPLLSVARRKLGVTRESCVCIGEEWVPQSSGAATARLAVAVDQPQACQQRYTGAFVGVSAQKLIDGLHYLSAGAVSFARGVNDTPKLVALLFLCACTPGLSTPQLFVLIGAAIAVGGLISARRVAETLSHKITQMNPGQGFTANLITSGLVLTASPLGLPLSTTHVSCGALFGIGAATRQAHWNVIGGIVGAWLVTLPLAAVLGASGMRLAAFFN